jgi:hypothetical protein
MSFPEREEKEREGGREERERCNQDIPDVQPAYARELWM